MIYEQVVAYCERRHITIADFEKLCNFGNGTVGKWKSENKPSLNSLQTLSAITHIPLHKWLKWWREDYGTGSEKRS